MGSIFGEAVEAYEPYEEEEEDPFDPFRAPAGPAVFGPGAQQFPSVAYGPPAPAYTPPLNPTVGGFRQSEMIPDPNATTSDPFALLSRAYEAANVDVPYVSDFMRDYAQPAVGGALNAMNPLSGPLNDLLGFDTGELAANAVVPVGALDFGLTFAPGIGDIPIDDIFRNAPDLARGAVRGALPEPTGYPGIGSPGMGPGDAADILRAGGFSPEDIAAFNASMNVAPPGTVENAADAASLAARDAYQVGGTDAARAAAASTYDNMVNGAPPAFPAAGYPSIPEGTMGSEFPWAQDMQDVTRGGRESSFPGWEGRVNERAIDPNSPAARMGAPLAYDPQFMTPPPADAAMRAAGAGPVDDALTGGGSTPGGLLPAPESVAGPVAATPPPASTTPLLPERTATPDFTTVGEPFPTPTGSQRIGNYIDEARDPSLTPSFPMTTDEAVTEAGRIGFPIQRETLERGTPLAKQQEMDRLSAAIDLDNFRKASSQNPALEQFVAAVKADKPVPADVPNPLKADGVPSSVAANPQAASMWDNVMDALYGPLQMDVGTPLRQDLTAMLDLTKIGQSRAVIGDAVRAASSRDEALKVISELDAMKAAADAKIGKVVDVQRPDIPGIRQTRGNVNREVMQSNLFGRIPVLGLPYNVTGRANAMVLESRRVREYVDFVNNLPDRAFATKDRSKWANQAQYFANQRAVTTGRGSLGSGQLERTLAGAGPIFTSLRYLLSIPQRVPYLVPVNRIAAGQWEVFGPAWREAAKEHAVFAGALASAYLAAEQAGAVIKDKDGDYTGKIKVGSTTIDLTGGMASYWNTIQKMADGNMTAGAEFLRNKTGPLVQGAAQVARLAGMEGKFLDFMRPEWFDRGATGSGKPADRAAAMIVPLWMQSVAKAVDAAKKSGENPLVQGAITGVTNFTGANTSSFPVNKRTEANNAVLDNPKNLESLPPNVAEFLQGKSWNAATAQEQRAILANVSPEERAAIEKGEQLLRERGDIFQLNRDETRARYELAAENRAKLQPVADKVLADWKSGAMDPMKAIDAMKRIEATADKEARFTSNVGPKLSESAAYQDALKGFKGEKTAEQKEVDRIREIEQKYYGVFDDPRVTKPDGTKDWDKIEAAQKAVLDTLRKQDPGFATRVEYNLQKDPSSDFEMTKWIAKIDDRLDKAGYFDQPTGQKTNFARANPEVDALLSFKNGWPVHSQAAGDILSRLAPERKVTYAK